MGIAEDFEKHTYENLIREKDDEIKRLKRWRINLYIIIVIMFLLLILFGRGCT